MLFKSGKLREDTPAGEADEGQASHVSTRRWHNSYMVTVGLKEAKNKLSELFTMALLGETVVITRQGESQSIRLTPIPRPYAASGFGMLREQLADLPSGWNSAEAEAEFLEQFEALDE